MRIGFDEARNYRWFPEQMFAFYFGNTAIFLVQNIQRWSLATKCARSSVQTSWTKIAVAFGKDSALPPAPPSETSLVCTAATSQYLKRVSRPRKEWIPEVFSLALSFTGSTRNLLFFVQNEKQWRQLVLNQWIDWGQSGCLVAQCL